MSETAIVPHDPDTGEIIAPPARSYVKKITTTLGWLRRLDGIDPVTKQPQFPPTHREPLMRIAGQYEQGWDEMSAFGSYIRWTGPIFHASVINANGTLSEYVSRNLIVPEVCSDFLLAYFDKSTAETSNKLRSGITYLPKQKLATVFCVFDIMLKPSQPGKVSGTGYEYEMVTIRADERFDPMAVFLADVPAFKPLGADVPALEHSTTATDGRVKSPAMEQPAEPAEPVPAHRHKNDRVKSPVMET